MLSHEESGKVGAGGDMGGRFADFGGGGRCVQMPGAGEAMFGGGGFGAGGVGIARAGCEGLGASAGGELETDGDSTDALLRLASRSIRDGNKVPSTTIMTPFVAVARYKTAPSMRELSNGF